MSSAEPSSISNRSSRYSHPSRDISTSSSIGSYSYSSESPSRPDSPSIPTSETTTATTAISPSISSFSTATNPNSTHRPDTNQSLHSQLRNLKNNKSQSVKRQDSGEERGQGKGKGKEKESDQEVTTDVGILDDKIYDIYLPHWVAPIRRALIKSLKYETPILAWQQRKVRSPILDKYFVYTSLLGTHSFFLIFLPMTFWLGNPYIGRGLVNVLAFGVYGSSAIKDLLCVPRPYSPPVTRLTIGTHHLEYGFPSTHSTNSLSIALYVYFWVRAFRLESSSIDESIIESALEMLQEGLSQTATTTTSSIGDWFLNSWFWELLLGFYSASVVYGRLYAGMHSFVDCVAGCALGIGVTCFQWFLFDHIEWFTEIEGWVVPLVTIPVGLLMVTVHPQPLDDCPCFEDAIAFIAVAMGVMIGRWTNIKYSLLPIEDHPFSPISTKSRDILKNLSKNLLPADSKVSDLVEPVLDAISSPFQSFYDHKTFNDSISSSTNSYILNAIVKISKSLAMMILGILVIFIVRIVVKTACKLILPKLIRFFSITFGFVLPRRHYIPATKYEKIPMDFNNGMMDAVPSVLELDLKKGFQETQDGHHDIQLHPDSNPNSPLSLSFRDQREAARNNFYNLSNSNSNSVHPTASFLDSDFQHISRPNSPFNPNQQSQSYPSNSIPTPPSRSTSPIPRSMSPSPSQLLRDTQSHRIKFGSNINGGKSLPIPFTHPDKQTDLPDDKVVDKLVSALSEEEKLKSKDPNWDQDIDKNIQHFDADVLTKVFVYGAIGFVATSPLPALFIRLGWSS